MNSLFSILNRKGGGTPIMRGVQAARAVELANEKLIELFGPQIAEFAQAAYVKIGTLAIACLSTTTAQEIRFKEAIIRDYINQKVGYEIVKKVKYLS